MRGRSDGAALRRLMNDVPTSVLEVAWEGLWVHHWGVMVVNIDRLAAAKGRAVSAKVRKAKAAERSVDLAPIIADLRANGATSFRDLAASLNERGIPTARGGSWSSAQVRRVLVDQPSNDGRSTDK